MKTYFKQLYSWKLENPFVYLTFYWIVLSCGVFIGFALAMFFSKLKGIK